MMFALQAMAQESAVAVDSGSLLERVDEDALAAMLILSVVLGIGAVIAVFGMLTSMVTKIFTHRENNRMVTDLINRGYSVDEIQKLMSMSKGEIEALDQAPEKQESGRRPVPLAAGNK